MYRPSSGRAWPWSVNIEVAGLARRDRFDFEQSGVIAWRERRCEIEILLVTSSTGKRWVIPKGHIEPDLSAVESAAVEAYEEAGIEGSPNRESLGYYEYRKWGGRYRVEVFLMEVDRQHADWPEAHRRKRRWFSAAKAAQQVDEDGLRQMIRQTVESPALVRI